uniref:Uncharacterized protein n=1 Tax=Arundo donax TaxID=35708 RepID=A0A0A9G568_ARUDO
MCLFPKDTTFFSLDFSHKKLKGSLIRAASLKYCMLGNQETVGHGHQFYSVLLLHES